MKITKYFIHILVILMALLIIATNAGILFLYAQNINKVQTDFNDKIAALQKEVSGLQGQVTSINKQNAAAAISVKELANRQIVEQKSQTQSVTDTVSKAVPAVVSIIITQNVPQYQVQYENPFGDDPLFQNFGMQIPVYTPTGKTASQEVGAGSGFIITSNGYILTNKHVVYDDSDSYTVLLSNGKQQLAKVIYKDPQNDIAIIKIDGNNFPTVKLGDSGTLQLGQTVVAIGNALGQYNNSVSMGIISGLNRTIQASSENGTVETLNGVIQTDAAINPGNSGGPLVDLNGDVIGIDVATAQGANNVSFSIPINTVKGIIKSAIGVL
jgi:serine protease Do